MSFRARRASQAILLVVAAGCARSNDQGSAGSTAPSASVVAAEAEPIAHGAAWTVGSRHAYRVKLTSTLAFGDQANMLDFTLTGRLTIAPTLVRGASSSLFIILDKTSIESRVPDPEGKLQAISEQLSKSGTFIEVDGGRVTEMRFARDLSPMVVSIYRTLAAALQVTVPTGTRDHFEAKERDGTGEYVAAYQGTGERSWSKHKLSYSKLLGKTAGTAPSTFQDILPEVRESSGEVQLAEDGRLVRSRSHDQLKIRGAQMPVNSMTEVQLDSDSVTAGAPVRDWRALGESLTRLGADEPYVQSADQQAMNSSMDDARINGQSFETVVDKLRATTTAREASARSKAANGTGKAGDAATIDQQETSQFVALTAMFRKRESDVAKALSRVRSDPAMAYTLVDALSSSGSPAAHKALAELLTAKNVDPKVRQRALGGLALTPRPSPVAVQALKAEVARDPFNTSALFGLGSFARYYAANGDSAQAKALGDLLIDRLGNTQDMVPRIVVTLQAIANSGYLGALDAVKKRLEDRRPEVRAAAIRALQYMPGTEIDQLLADALTDKETEVNLAVLASTRARKPSDVLVQALTGAAQTAQEPKVRYGSVQLLAQWKKERADVLDVIQRVASKDSEESIRTLAKSAL